MRRSVRVVMLFVLMLAAAFAFKQPAKADMPQYKDINRSLVRVKSVKNGAVDFDVVYDGTVLTRGYQYRLAQCDVITSNKTHAVSMTVEGLKTGGFLGAKFQQFYLIDGKTPVDAYNAYSSAVVGKATQLSAFGGSGALKFTSETPSIASVDPNTGILTGINTGTAAIKVEDQISKASTTLFIPVLKSNITANQFQILYNKKVFFTGRRIMPEVLIFGIVDGRMILLQRNVDFKVNYAHNKKVGTALMKVTGINRYSGAFNLKFKIKKSRVPLVGYLPKDEFLAGQKVRIHISSSSKAGRKLKFKSSNRNVAKVSGSGKITGVGPGTAVITVKAKENRNTKAAKLKFRVEVHSNGTKITKLTSERQSDGSYDIHIRWKRYRDVDGYQIFWMRPGKSGMKTFYDRRLNNATMTDCRPNVKYKLRIRTFWYDDFGNTIYSPWSSFKSVKTSRAKPSTPSLNSVSNPSGTRSIYVSWNPIKSADGYQIEFRNQSTGFVGYHDVGNSHASSSTITGLTSGCTYSIRIRSYIDDGGRIYSDWSGSMSATVANSN